MTYVMAAMAQRVLLQGMNKKKRAGREIEFAPMAFACPERKGREEKKKRKGKEG